MAERGGTHGYTLGRTRLSHTDKAMIDTCLRCQMPTCQPQHKQCPFVKTYGYWATPTVLRQHTAGKATGEELT
jgi:hypothetical protein